MARPHLTALAEELLNEIWTMFDCGSDDDLMTSRKDLANVSLTCKLLRESVIPVLFYTATMNLRWEDGALVEPAIYRLIKQRPDTARHVRCVRIKPVFEHQVKGSTLFTVPDIVDSTSGTLEPKVSEHSHESKEYVRHLEMAKDAINRTHLNHWEAPLVMPDAGATPTWFHQALFSKTSYTREGQERQQENVRRSREARRRRLEERRKLKAAKEREAQEHYRRWKENPQAYPPPPIDYEEEEGCLGYPPAVHDHRMFSDKLRFRLQIDALAVAILSIPWTVTSLTVICCPRVDKDNFANNSALSVASMAIRVFGRRIRTLTFKAVLPQGGPYRRHRKDVGEYNIITADILSELTGLNSLTLTTDADGFRGYRERWHIIPAKLTRLELYNVVSEERHLVIFVIGFGCLEELVLRRVSLQFPNTGNRDIDASPLNRMHWLSVMLTLRRNMLHLEIGLVDARFSTLYPPKPLPPPKVQWLMQSMPAGSLIGIDKESRLKEEWKMLLQEPEN